MSDLFTANHKDVEFDEVRSIVGWTGKRNNINDVPLLIKSAILISERVESSILLRGTDKNLFWLSLVQ